MRRAVVAKHETPRSRQLRFFTSKTSKTLNLCPAPASSSDAFRKGVTSRTPPSPVRNGWGFRPCKTVLGSTTPSTGEAAPRGVAVAKAFAQEQKQATSAALTHKPRSRRRGHCCPLVVATHHHREPDLTTVSPNKASPNPRGGHGGGVAACVARGESDAKGREGRGGKEESATPQHLHKPQPTAATTTATGHHRNNYQLLRQIRSTGFRSALRAPEPTAWATGQRPSRRPCTCAGTSRRRHSHSSHPDNSTQPREGWLAGLPRSAPPTRRREPRRHPPYRPDGHAGGQLRRRRGRREEERQSGGGLGSRPCRPAWERRERGR
jgi:hypothetical protein